MGHCSATRSASARRGATSWRLARASRRCCRCVGAAHAADGRRPLGRASRRPSSPPGCAGSTLRATTMRPATMRQNGCANAGGAGIDVRELVPVHGRLQCRLCRLGPDALVAHLAEQLAPADVARFCRRSAARYADAVAVHGVAPEGGSCCAGGERPSAGKKPRHGLPERRSAGGRAARKAGPPEPAQWRGG